jgi:hypothetical protein
MAVQIAQLPNPTASAVQIAAMITRSGTALKT